jgi:hypothetical protein
MKTVMQKNLWLLLVLFLLSGCAQLARPLTGAALAAGGALAGHKLSNGDPLATTGGAAAGVLVSEGIHAWKNRCEQRAYTQGFQKGRSDGVKQLYWNLQAEQRNPPGPARAFEVRVPAHRDGDVLFDETKQTIRD